MNIKYPYFGIFMLLIPFVAISCQTPKQQISDNEKAFSQTTSYNYLLDLEQIDKNLFPGKSSLFSLASIIESAGYGKPVIEGKHSVEQVVLQATYPVMAGFEESASILARLADTRTTLPGQIHRDKLIAYIKIPGMGNIFNVASDYHRLSDKNQNEKLCAMLFQVKGDKVLIAAGVKGADAKAGEWIKNIAPILGGGGGGRPDFAQAGGKDITKISEAKEKAKVYITEVLG